VELLGACDGGGHGGCGRGDPSDSLNHGLRHLPLSRRCRLSRLALGCLRRRLLLITHTHNNYDNNACLHMDGKKKQEKK
jgi:hypothetical protein